jgi:adenylate kinase
VVILLGPPGGGKGTQAERIIKEFGIGSVSTGDLLRAEVAKGTPLGNQVKAVMAKGDLVSDDIVNGLVAARFKQPDAAKGLILDGYPRTVPQAEFLDRFLTNRKTRPMVINLAVPADEIVARLAKRGRADDKPETVRERLRVYDTETKPLLDFYASRGLENVDGTGTPDEIFARVRAAINRHRM